MSVAGLPSRLGHGNGGDRTPELVVVLGVPESDGCIGHRNIQQCENASLTQQAEAVVPGDDGISNAIPDAVCFPVQKIASSVWSSVR